MRNINILNILGADGRILNSVDGIYVYHQAVGFLQAGENIRLDFAGVKGITSEFLNFSVAHLAKAVSMEVLKRNLVIVGLTDCLRKTLKDVIWRVIDAMGPASR